MQLLIGMEMQKIEPLNPIIPPMPVSWKTSNAMTMRDEFAKAALSWALSKYTNADRYYSAQAAYEVADAMMKARDGNG